MSSSSINNIISLRDFVSTVADASFGFNISPKWRCRVAPCIDNDADMLPIFDQGIPLMPPKANSAPVHDKCTDGIAFINDPAWRDFPAPKVAFKTGWAGPGTEMENEDLHQMVRGFDEVLDSTKCIDWSELIDEEMAKDPSAFRNEEERQSFLEMKKQQEEEKKKSGSSGEGFLSPDVLNLQLFHRADPTTHPQMPVLAELLKWPTCLEPGVVCDNATRVSKKGAVTWWHLDDCGEFVIQTGLRLPDTARDEHIPVKLFIYSPPATYDWMMHDAQSEKCGRIASLDILHAPSDSLPPAEMLPILTVAVLRSGDRPLVSPPNIPHLVISLVDCIMVEQRKIVHHFMHEVAYFAQKMQHWKSTPVVYKFLADDLQKAEGVKAAALKIEYNLKKVDHGDDEGASSGTATSSSAEQQHKKKMKQLCVRSLLSLMNSELFPGSAAEDVQRFLKEILDRYVASSSSSSGSGSGSDDGQQQDPHAILAEAAEFLKEYCYVEKVWAANDESRQHRRRLHGVVKQTVSVDVQNPQQQQQQISKNDTDDGGGEQEEEEDEPAVPTEDVFCILPQFRGKVRTAPVGFSAMLYFGTPENKSSTPPPPPSSSTHHHEDPHRIVKIRQDAGYFPLFGPVRSTPQQARDDAKRAFTTLVSTAAHHQQHASALRHQPFTCAELVSALTVATKQDELLDELF